MNELNQKNIEKQLLTDAEKPSPKKTQWQIRRISWKTYRISSSKKFRTQEQK